MKICSLATVLLTIFSVACTDHQDSSSVEVDDLTDPIETLWVADQITGIMGMWMRNQQRYLITDETISYQGIDLKIGDGIAAEIYSSKNPIVSHRKNEHGGVIEYGQAPGELLTITQEMDEDRERYLSPLRSMELYEPEGDEPNSILAYRWLDGGRVELIDLYPEEDGPEGKLKPLDADSILASLADPVAFAALRWIDEESLLPNDPPYVNLAELRTMESSLQAFPAGDKTAYEKVSGALDRVWEAMASDKAPNHLGGMGQFVSSYRFAKAFPKAMAEAGYHPIIGAFDFARTQDLTNFEDEPSESDLEVIKVMQSRTDPYREFFEASLAALVGDEGRPENLPEYSSKTEKEQTP